MASGGTETFPDLGKNCQHRDCNRLDFLPYICDGCQRVIIHLSLLIASKLITKPSASFLHSKPNFIFFITQPNNVCLQTRYQCPNMEL